METARTRGPVAGVALLLAAQWTSPGVELGVHPYPGSVPLAQTSRRLEMLRNVRWQAAAAFHTDASLKDVLQHFQRERARVEGPAGTGGEPSGRLKEWLEKEPEELAKYREYRREASAGISAAEWQVVRQKVAEIPLSLGGGPDIRSPAHSDREVEFAFGRFSLPDSTVSVQLLSPHPSEDGRTLRPGTLVAIIRESREGPPPAAVSTDETIEGPETSDLTAGLSGYVLMDHPVGGMVALALPTLQRVTVRRPESAVGVVHSLAGPDEEGRIAYVENHASAGRHYLKSIRVDGGQDEKIFERPGDAFFERAIGSSLALSPRGGAVAVIGRLARFQTNRPSFPLRIGPLEVWDLGSKSGRELGIHALDRRLSWFPDGRSLVYVELIPAGKAPSVLRAEEDGFGGAFRGWEAVPVVRVVDVVTGERRTIHPGWDPVVASDGRSLLLRDPDNHWRLVDVRSGSSRPVAWPGDAGGAIALAPGNLVLYWGLPTRGAPPEFTRIYSLSVGPRPMKTLKVAKLETRLFQTVLSSIDPRREVSFGTAPVAR